MSVFKDADEVYEFLGAMFRTVLHDEQFVAAAKELGLTIRLESSDPDSVIVVDFSRARVYCGDIPADVASNVTIFMSASDAHKFWLGRLNAVMAMTKGQLRMQGPVSRVMKLLPLTKPLFAAYEGVIKERGRHDLLDVA